MVKRPLLVHATVVTLVMESLALISTNARLTPIIAIPMLIVPILMELSLAAVIFVIPEMEILVQIMMNVIWKQIIAMIILLVPIMMAMVSLVQMTMSALTRPMTVIPMQFVLTNPALSQALATLAILAMELFAPTLVNA